jgi:hypothetical protein
MEEQLKLSRYSESEEVDATQYQRLVGSLAFTVRYVSRFMEQSTVEHQQAIKRILSLARWTTACGMSGVLVHHTSSATVTATSPVTSTRARARVVSCSSSTTVMLAGSSSSSGWWHCQDMKLSTSLPLRCNSSTPTGSPTGCVTWSKE